tara:strand:+ start:12190 stop:13326 length:1137 start_codon:yes stop_codon:yes gene_type:complete
MYVLGLMSGTSADGVDAALVNFFGNPKKPRWKLDKMASLPYPNKLKQAIVTAGQNIGFTGKDWLDISEAITELYAKLAIACDPHKKAQFVSCHGQTIWHRPPSEKRRGASLQLLQAPLLATLLNKRIICDFRSFDLAWGGQGAPLVPLVDEALFGRIDSWRVFLNLGGIANITLIPPKKGPDAKEAITGWDCGPANSLLDLAVQKFSNGKSLFDRDGEIASQGLPNKLIIKQWLKEPYFLKNPPKSSGRDCFGWDDLNRRLNELNNLSCQDILATLSSFTASIIEKDLKNLQKEKNIVPSELVISGGGARNLNLVSEIKSKCLGTQVIALESLGCPSHAREAIAFALLGLWQQKRIVCNTNEITGASKSCVLGISVDP